MPGHDREKAVMARGGVGNVTFHDQLSKVPFEVIDGRKKDFNVEDELFGHSNSFQVLTTAHVS
jgi:hypothetical protein